MFRDTLNFSPSIALEKVTSSSPEANAVLAQHGYAMNRTLVNEDEPAHLERRRALMHSFLPEALEDHEPMVRRLTAEYVDRFIRPTLSTTCSGRYRSPSPRTSSAFPRRTWRPCVVTRSPTPLILGDGPRPRSSLLSRRQSGSFGPTRAACSRRCASAPPERLDGICAATSERNSRGRNRLLPALHDDGRHRRRARDHRTCRG